MATQKPISTISYNSESFLREKLDSWVQQHIIQTYMYICHKGEDGDKDHIHLRIEPNKKLDPMSLTELLSEYDPSHPDKPLTVRPWRPSKEEDWILYAVHDNEYLSLKYNGGDKGEKLPYDWKNIVVPSFYDMEIAFIRARSSLKHSTVSMANRIQKGDNPLSLITDGENPFIVNAISKAVYTSDYARLNSVYQDLRIEYDNLSFRFDALISAIENYGLDIVVNDDGSVSLQSPKDGFVNSDFME